MLLLFIAVTLFCVTLADVFITLLSLRGGGFVTRRLSVGFWRVLLAVHRRRRIHSVLALAGPMMLAGIVLLWYAMLFTSWACLFASHYASVVHQSDSGLTSAMEKVYFIGVTLSDLGYGDLVPSGAPWTLLSSAAALSATIITSAAISYILPVVAAGLEKRSLARSLRAFGDDATVMLERFWSGGSQPLTSQMVDSLRDLQTFSDKPEAYPILHFFHSPEPRFALSRAVLDVAEALFWWSYAVAPEQRLNKAVSEICFDALRTYCGPRVSENDQPSECPELSQAKWQRLGLSPVAVDHAAQDMYRQLRGQLEKICRDDGWGYSP